MKNIICVQHTQSIHHTNGMIGSWTDWDLSELGIRQADNIGKALKSEIQDNQYVIYSSDLKRAAQTANKIASHLKVQPILKKELRELNLGSAVGKSVEWFKNSMLSRNDSVCEVDYRFLEDAESQRELYIRVKAFLDDILCKENENIIIVSHGDTLRMLFYIWMYNSLDDFENRKFGGVAGGVSMLCEDQNGKRIIKKLNDVSYINYQQ
ncbi:histidine phosphatase family protein [Inconstantimicrobium mannanitabidum]|uniref:Histidine phosphatase family protein n=1 Tax=Inconstantimicrobium mannanitabidum TaxID=1604901 RepID=A0ACB5RBF9_9CLOT|nr:histidine phosphatase family protein [Clostridium sp. TW13]GKX66570.1 histidine phosphatase family protein [Clostridium sp. TW13]